MSIIVTRIVNIKPDIKHAVHVPLGNLSFKLVRCRGWLGHYIIRVTYVRVNLITKGLSSCPCLVVVFSAFDIHIIKILSSYRPFVFLPRFPYAVELARKNKDMVWKCDARRIEKNINRQLLCQIMTHLCLAGVNGENSRLTH